MRCFCAQAQTQVDKCEIYLAISSFRIPFILQSKFIILVLLNQLEFTHKWFWIRFLVMTKVLKPLSSLCVLYTLYSVSNILGQRSTIWWWTCLKGVLQIVCTNLWFDPKLTTWQPIIIHKYIHVYSQCLHWAYTH